MTIENEINTIKVLFSYNKGDAKILNFISVKGDKSNI